MSPVRDRWTEIASKSELTDLRTLVQPFKSGPIAGSDEQKGIPTPGNDPAPSSLPAAGAGRDYQPDELKLDGVAYRAITRSTG